MSAAAPSRRRRLLLALALAALALVLVVALALAWLLGTAGGRDFALARAGAALGEDALAWGEAEGRLGGTVVLRELRLRLPAVEARADRLELRLAPSALLGGRLQVESLALDQLVLQLRDAGTDDQPFALPDLRLPRLRPPLAVSLESLEVRGLALYAAGADRPTLDIARVAAAAGLDAEGRVSIARLALDAAAGALRATGMVDLGGARDLALVLRARGPGEDAPWARAELQGEGEEASLALAAPEGGGEQLRLRLGPGRRWTLALALEGFDPSPWWPAFEGAPLDLALSLDGQGRSVVAEGRFDRGEAALLLEPSTLALGADGRSLRLDPLLLRRAAGGGLRVEGELSLDPEGESALRLALEALPLGAQRQLDGEGRLDGRPDDWRLAFGGSLGLPGTRLPLALDAAGDRTMAEVEELLLGESAGPRLAASGRVARQPSPTAELALRLADFDPALLHADWPGRLDGELALAASDDGSGWQGRIEVARLSGRLRGLALRASGALAFAANGEVPDGSLDLAWGESRVRLSGRAGAGLDIEARLQPLLLAPLAPGLDGRLEGRVRVSGARAAPRVELELAGQGLQQGGRRVEALRLDAVIGSGGADAATEGRLEARGLSLDGLQLDRLDAQLAGSRARHRLELSGASDDLGIEAALAGGLDPVAGWRGRLESLSLSPGERRWTLDAPAELAVAGDSLALSRACLAGGATRICARVDGGAGALAAELELERMPLAALPDLLPAATDWPLALDGELEADARLRRDTEGRVTLDGRLRLPEGRAAVAGAEGRELLDWRAVEADWSLDESGLRASASGTLEGDGRLALTLSGSSPLDAPDGPLSGRLELVLPRLRALELLAPDLANADGQLAATITLDGSWTQPRLSGSAQASALSGELPALGIRFSDSRLGLADRAGGGLAVTGQFDTGGGPLEVTGWIDPAGEGGLRGQLRLEGEDVRVADTVFVRAIASPALDLELAPGQIRLSGRVVVPEARLDLEYLDDSVRPSPDVVVLDPRDGDGASRGPALRADVDVVLGEDVRLEGFGFDGRVSGRLAVSERPGRVPTGRGALEVTGTYQAYGQDLELVRGALQFAGTPLDNPALDVRAERAIDAQVVGIEVRGSALDPRLSLYSNPSLDQAEALSYLVLGRPLRSATEADGAELGQAAAAIGGNLLAERLGARLGFDTFGVADSRALGGAAFSVGKYLSPKLYLGYGVALFGSGQVLTLRYLLSSRWEVEVESGTENRAGLNYKLER